MNRTITVDPAARRPAGAVASAIARGRASVPAALVFAPLYAVAVAGIIAARMLLAEQATGGRFATVVGVTLAAAFAAGALGWIAAAAVAGSRPASARFAAMLVALVVGTAAFIAFGQYLAYQLGDGVRNDRPEFPSLHWVLTMLGGGASAVYVTVAVALRLLLPAGLIPLFAGAAVFVRLTGSRRG